MTIYNQKMNVFFTPSLIPSPRRPHHSPYCKYYTYLSSPPFQNPANLPKIALKKPFFTYLPDSEYHTNKLSLVTVTGKSIILRYFSFDTGAGFKLPLKHVREKIYSLWMRSVQHSRINHPPQADYACHTVYHPGLLMYVPFGEGIIT